MPANVKYSKVYLRPTIEGELIKDYPFSYTFLAHVLTNAVNRKNHPTLDNSDLPKAFGIIFSYMRFNKGWSYD
jgi:hypothetical protein